MQTEFIETILTQVDLFPESQIKENVPNANNANKIHTFDCVKNSEGVHVAIALRDPLQQTTWRYLYAFKAYSGLKWFTEEIPVSTIFNGVFDGEDVNGDLDVSDIENNRDLGLFKNINILLEPESQNPIVIFNTRSRVPFQQPDDPLRRFETEEVLLFVKKFGSVWGGLAGLGTPNFDSALVVSLVSNVNRLWQFRVGLFSDDIGVEASLLLTTSGYSFSSEEGGTYTVSMLERTLRLTYSGRRVRVENIVSTRTIDPSVYTDLDVGLNLRVADTSTTGLSEVQALNFILESKVEQIIRLENDLFLCEVIKFAQKSFVVIKLWLNSRLAETNVLVLDFSDVTSEGLHYISSLDLAVNHVRSSSSVAFVVGAVSNSGVFRVYYLESTLIQLFSRDTQLGYGSLIKTVYSENGEPDGYSSYFGKLALVERAPGPVVYDRLSLEIVELRDSFQDFEIAIKFSQYSRSLSFVSRRNLSVLKGRARLSMPLDSIGWSKYDIISQDLLDGFLNESGLKPPKVLYDALFVDYDDDTSGALCIFLDNKYLDDVFPDFYRFYFTHKAWPSQATYPQGNFPVFPWSVFPSDHYDEPTLLAIRREFANIGSFPIVESSVPIYNVPISFDLSFGSGYLSPEVLLGFEQPSVVSDEKYLFFIKRGVRGVTQPVGVDEEGNVINTAILSTGFNELIMSFCGDDWLWNTQLFYPVYSFKLEPVWGDVDPSVLQDVLLKDLIQIVSVEDGTSIPLGYRGLVVYDRLGSELKYIYIDQDLARDVDTVSRFMRLRAEGATLSAPPVWPNVTISTVDDIYISAPLITKDNCLHVCYINAGEFSSLRYTWIESAFDPDIPPFGEWPIKDAVIYGFRDVKEVCILPTYKFAVEGYPRSVYVVYLSVDDFSAEGVSELSIATVQPLRTQEGYELDVFSEVISVDGLPVRAAFISAESKLINNTVKIVIAYVDLELEALCLLINDGLVPSEWKRTILEQFSGSGERLLSGLAPKLVLREDGAIYVSYIDINTGYLKLKFNQDTDGSFREYYIQLSNQDEDEDPVPGINYSRPSMMIDRFNNVNVTIQVASSIETGTIVVYNGLNTNLNPFTG